MKLGLMPNRTVEKHGNSYTTELTHDARRYAVRFLEETADEWEDPKDSKMWSFFSNRPTLCPLLGIVPIVVPNVSIRRWSVDAE